MSIGVQVTIQCGEQSILVGMSLGRHGAVLCNYYSTLVNMSQGGHYNILYSHHVATQISMTLYYVVSMPHFLAKPGWHGTVLCGHHAKLVGVLLGNLG